MGKRAQISTTLKKAELAIPDRSLVALVKSGAAMIHAVLNHAKLPDGQPAFRWALEYDPRQSRQHKEGRIYAHPEVYAQFKHETSISEQMITDHKPMVIPPIPWEGTHKGGYLKNSVNVLRGATTEQLTMTRTVLTQLTSETPH